MKGQEEMASLEEDNRDIRNQTDLLALRVQELDTHLVLARQSERKSLEALAYVRWMLAGKLPDVMPRPESGLLSFESKQVASNSSEEREEDGQGSMAKATRIAGSVAGDMLGVCALYARVIAAASDSPGLR